MSADATFKPWPVLVKLARKFVSVCSTEVPDSLDEPRGGCFHIYDPTRVVLSPSGVNRNYLKGDVVLVVAGFVDENAHAVHPGVYGAAADAPTSGGTTTRFPNFPESLQTQPATWHYLCERPLKIKSCSLGVDVGINASAPA